MEKETGSSNREEPFEIDWSVHGESRAASGASEGAEEAEPPDGGGDLPTEPAVPEDTSKVSTLNELLEFYLYKRRGPRAVPDASAERPMPALLHAYRDVAAIRHDYPLCMTAAGDVPVRTLTAVVDEVASRIAAGDDETAKQRERHILALETEMRRICDAEGGAMLSAVWDRAARTILENQSSQEKQEQLRASFSAARDVLETDGELLPCAPETILRLYMVVAAASWRRRCSRWRDELAALYARTQNILAADESHSADLHSPDHLRDATGGEDMDFEAMSAILQESHVGEPLPEGRRNRIRRALDAIAKVKPLFDGSVSLLDAKAQLPFDLQPVRNVCKAARDRHDERVRSMVEFFKAVRIAELESANQYRESTHDRFFAQFDASHLTAEELSFCPPVVVVLDGGFFESPDMSGLFDLLGSGLPVKVFAQIDDLAAGGTATGSPASVPGWAARLGSMVAALGDVCVSQATASTPVAIRDSVAAAFDYDGTAVTIVYTGDADTQPGLPPYLAAAAALESRLFPAFASNPADGATLAERMSVDGNPHLEKTWPADTFTYADATGDEQSLELEFTAADFLYNDIRFEAHFMAVEPERWHSGMTLLHHYLALAPAELEGRVPYITAVDDTGTVVRIAVTHHVVDMARRVAASWRLVQESGGIGNSFAAQALAEASARLEAQKQQEIEALEKKYASDLERDLGDLTQEIVQRIAARLLTEGTGPMAPAAPPRPATAPAVPAPAPETETAPEPAPAEEEDDDIVVTEDPYIDTPLCTSCNECTKINGLLFNYDGNKQAFIADADAGTFRDLVMAAEKCPVRIIHPGKPRDPSESGLDDLIKRAEPFN